MKSGRLLIFCVLLTSSLIRPAQIYSQAEIADSRDTLQLRKVQFKATHNSYQFEHTPQVQIDNYDVWEIELDFGMVLNSQEFYVGHDAPESKHGLTTLGDWVGNVLKAEKLKLHPLILKLEAKTTGPCEFSRFRTFTCADNWPETWQAMLVDSLREWIGSDYWITYRKYRDDLKGQWPKVSELAGKVIVTLQDSNEDRDIDRRSDYFFMREIPGLRAIWPPIKNADDLQKALKSGVNRLTMDDAYREPWTNQSSRSKPLRF